MIYPFVLWLNVDDNSTSCLMTCLKLKVLKFDSVVFTRCDFSHDVLDLINKYKSNILFDD